MSHHVSCTLPGGRGATADYRQLTAVSLFAGIGGIDLALERAGVQVVAAVEIDPACRAVLARHFPQARLFSDVREVSGDDLRAAGFVPERGVLAAGWPCQGNSVAGRRGGMADPRSGLWMHVPRLLAELRPAWFLGENVPGLYSVRNGADIAVVRNDLAQLGYWWAERILDAQHFGIPQRRRRVFFVGCPGDGTRPVQVLLEPESGTGDPAAGGEARTGTAAVTSCGPGGPGAVGTLQGGGRRGHRVDAEGAASGHLVPVAVRGRDGGSQIEAGEAGDPAFTVRTPGGGSSVSMVAYALTARNDRNDRNDREENYALVPPGQITHALTAEGADASEDGTGRSTPIVPIGVPLGEDVRAFNPQSGGTKARLGYGETPTALQASQITAIHAATAVRRLTPRECERLQGFPDDWTRWLADGTEQPDSARYRECGNAVAVPCMEWIARRLVAAHEDPERAA